MELKQIEIYEYDELSDDAKEKALSNFNEHNEYDFLSDDLSEYLNVLLEENGIKGDAKLFYSLSYSQGDGVCFEGYFEYKGISFNVKHDNGHYYHSNSVYIDADFEDDGDDLKGDVIEALENEFKEVYKEICDKIEKSGYSQIEYERGEENFKELCDANEYTFEKNGTMRNF